MEVLKEKLSLVGYYIIVGAATKLFETTTAICIAEAAPTSSILISNLFFFYQPYNLKNVKSIN